MSSLLVQRLADLNLIRDPASAGTKTLVISRHRKAGRRHQQFNIGSDDVVIHRRGTLQRRSSTDGSTQNLGNIDVVLHRRSSLQRTPIPDQIDRRKPIILATKYGKNSLNLQELNSLDNYKVRQRSQYYQYRKSSGTKSIKMTTQVNGIVNNLHEITSEENYFPSNHSIDIECLETKENIENMNLVESNDFHARSIPNSLDSSDQMTSSEDQNLDLEEVEDLVSIGVKERSLEEDVSMTTELDDNSLNSMEQNCHDDKIFLSPCEVFSDDDGKLSPPINQEEIIRNVVEASKAMNRGNGLVKLKNRTNRTKSKCENAFLYPDENIEKAVNIGAAYKESRLRERSKDIVDPYRDDPSEAEDMDSCHTPSIKEDGDTDQETDRLLGQQRSDDPGYGAPEKVWRRSKSRTIIPRSSNNLSNIINNSTSSSNISPVNSIDSAKNLVVSPSPPTLVTESTTSTTISSQQLASSQTSTNSSSSSLSNNLNGVATTSCDSSVSTNDVTTNGLSKSPIPLNTNGEGSITSPSTPIGQRGSQDETSSPIMVQNESHPESETPLSTTPEVSSAVTKPKMKKEKDSTKKKGRSKEVMVHEPAVLIEGVLFRARYLGSTQLVSEGQPTKTTRMMQAEEAVTRIKESSSEVETDRPVAGVTLDIIPNDDLDSDTPTTSTLETREYLHEPQAISTSPYPIVVDDETENSYSNMQANSAMAAGGMTRKLDDVKTNKRQNRKLTVSDDEHYVVKEQNIPLSSQDYKILLRETRKLHHSDLTNIEETPRSLQSPVDMKKYQTFRQSNYSNIHSWKTQTRVSPDGKDNGVITVPCDGKSDLMGVSNVPMESPLPPGVLEEPIMMDEESKISPRREFVDIIDDYKISKYEESNSEDNDLSYDIADEDKVNAKPNVQDDSSIKEDSNIQENYNTNVAEDDGVIMYEEDSNDGLDRNLQEVDDEEDVNDNLTTLTTESNKNSDLNSDAINGNLVNSLNSGRDLHTINEQSGDDADKDVSSEDMYYLRSDGNSNFDEFIVNKDNVQKETKKDEEKNVNDVKVNGYEPRLGKPVATSTKSASHISKHGETSVGNVAWIVDGGGGIGATGTVFHLRLVGSVEVSEEISAKNNASKRPKKDMVTEAVAELKTLAPDGETQPNTEVDLFISTEKIMVLNTDLKEIMMDHALRTISYIADIGDLVVLMARRRMLPTDDPNTLQKAPKMICHVFESDEAQFIAQSIGQAFQVAYLEFLKANGIEDHSFVKEMDYQEVLNSQEIFGDELQMFAKKELQKEVVVPKMKSEILGVVVVESGWGSMVPTVVIANLSPIGAAAKCGQLNIGDQIIAINGVSLVGLPLSTCQNYIKNTKYNTAVKLTVVPCPPVVEVKIRRPDTKYQLGFSVQNGVICSLLRGGIAERGGVRVGHRIIDINSQSVVAVPHEKIVNLLATSVGEIRMKTMPTSIFRLLTGQETPQYI